MAVRVLTETGVPTKLSGATTSAAASPWAPPPLVGPGGGSARDALHLERVEAAVDAVARDQLVVPPDLRDAAVVDDHDAVGVAHGGQAVRDHEHGAAAHQVGERLLDD